MTFTLKSTRNNRFHFLTAIVAFWTSRNLTLPSPPPPCPGKQNLGQTVVAKNMCTHTSGKVIQGRKDAGLTTHCLFLDVQKAYDTVWRNGSLEKYVGDWDQRKKDVGHDENDDGMCEKCCDAGRGNIPIC